MTLGVVHALLEDGTLTEELLIHKWREEYENNTKLKDGVSRAGYGTIALYFQGKQDLEGVKAGQAKRKYPGNAPPMRAIPIGFVTESIINSYATINADATHPHPKSTASSIIIARATEFFLLKNPANSGIIPYCLSHIENIDEETNAYLRAVDELGAEVDEEDYKVLCGEQPTTSFPEGNLWTPIGRHAPSGHSSVYHQTRKRHF